MSYYPYLKRFFVGIAVSSVSIIFLLIILPDVILLLLK